MAVHRLDAQKSFGFGLSLVSLNSFPPMWGEQELWGKLRKVTRVNRLTLEFVVYGNSEGLSCESHPEKQL